MKRSVYKNNRGQLIIEYVLLLAMAAVVSGIIVNNLASRDPGNPGAIITGWSKVVQSIGADKVDDCNPSKCP
jgi:hypothetical protein